MIATVVLVPSQADAPLVQEHPLIDVDHTVWIQLLLFLVVALIGSRLLFRPYLKMRDDRAAGIGGARDEASRLSAEADARLAHYQTQVESARVRAQDERRKTRTEAARKQREMTDKARDESTVAFDKARGSIAVQTETARGELLPRTTDLAEEIAGQLLGRKVAG